MSLEPHRADHTCVLVDGLDEQRSIVLPFIRAGLRNGEQCIYIAEGQPEEWLLELQAYGLDVASAQESGRLHVTHARALSEPGELNSIQLARAVWARLRLGLSDFPAVRFATDMGFMAEVGTTDAQLCHWEATLDRLLEDLACQGLCLFDLGRLAPGLICAALRTHPIAMYKGRAYQNPHYDVPRILEHEPDLYHMDADIALIEEMLAKLVSAREVSPQC